MHLPIEYIHYAPYGEPLAIEHNGNYRKKYLFTGKERDEETGLDYFGVRGTTAGVSYNRFTKEPEPQFFFQSWAFLFHK